MVGAPDVVQPWMPRAPRDKRGVPLAREHRGWTEAPRMCRSRRIGILGRALKEERPPRWSGGRAYEEGPGSGGGGGAASVGEEGRTTRGLCSWRWSASVGRRLPPGGRAVIRPWG